MKEISSLKSKNTPQLGKLSVTHFRPAIAFFATFALYVFLSVVCQKYPFGDYSVSISDLSAQYAPFLAMFRNRMDLAPGSGGLLSHMMYSFDIGMGSNYMATFGYYLASPFNLLFAFVDSSYIDAFVLFLMTVKMSFSSAFMCMFMGERAKDRKCLWPILWGVMYSFTSYTTAFIFSIMWLDGYMLLPLLLCFTERFITKGKKAGLIITLLVLFLSNFYIAYMVGIFVFIYLLVRMGTLGMYSNIKSAIGKIVRFIAIAVIDALIMCVVLIPVGLSTIANGDPTVSSAEEHYVLYNLKDMLDHIFIGTPGEFGDIMPANLPFFFSGLLVTSLIVIFFVSKAFDRKDKIRYLLCLAGVYLSTAVYWIDVAWQVFDSPNWFWHRHSFVFIPLFLIIAAKVYEEFAKVTKREIMISFGILVVLLFLAQSFGNMSEAKTFLFNLGFLAALFVILFFMNKRDWGKGFEDMPMIMPLILTIVVVFEVVYIQPLLSTDLSAFTLYGGSSEQYRTSILAMQDLGEVQVLTSQKNRAFRAENEVIADYANSNYVLEHPNMFGAYHGISFFNSSSNKSLHRFIKQLGFPVNYNYFATSYTYTASDSDAFLSVGALTTMREYSNSVFVNDDQFDIGYHFYANKHVLPLAFAADKGSMDFDYYQLEKASENKDYFAFRNLWFKSLFPDNFTEDYFITLPAESVEGPEVTNAMTTPSELTTMAKIKASEESVSKSDTSSDEDPADAADKDKLGLEDLAAKEAEKNVTTYYRSNEDIPMYIEYRTKAPRTGEMYFNLTAPTTTGTMSVYVDGIFIAHASKGTYFSQVYRLGTYNEGDDIKVIITSDDDKFTYLDARFGYFDFEKFGEQFGGIDRDKVIVNEASDGYVNLTTNITDKELVITTIPYEKGWTLLVDGVESEIRPYQEAFVAFEVPSGSHTAELKFTAPGFKAGALASCVGLVILPIFLILDRKKNRTAKNDSPAPGKSDK